MIEASIDSVWQSQGEHLDRETALAVALLAREVLLRCISRAPGQISFPGSIAFRIFARPYHFIISFWRSRLRIIIFSVEI